MLVYVRRYDVIALLFIELEQIVTKDTIPLLTSSMGEEGRSREGGGSISPWNWLSLPFPFLFLFLFWLTDIFSNYYYLVIVILKFNFKRFSHYWRWHRAIFTKMSIISCKTLNNAEVNITVDADFWCLSWYTEDKIYIYIAHFSPMIIWSKLLLHTEVLFYSI